MARVFISYADRDLVWACEVRGWLVESGHEVFLDQERNGVVVGEQWRQRLRWADAVVCVVTSASVVSSRCIAEVAVAQARGSRLLPLRAEPDVDHPLLAEVQHTDLTRDSVAARTALIAALRGVDAAGGAGWPGDRSPFPGLRPFEVDQHRVYFGRADEIKQLAELVRASAGGAALLVVGPSGCGKSSLVRAGLVPVMAAEPGWRVLPPILPGADPISVLARELVVAAGRIGLDWAVEQVHHRLGENGFADLVDELLLADPDGPQRRLLLVVDQFEELLTQTAPEERRRFAELLRPALARTVRVVATLRPEFLDRLLADSDLATLPTDLDPLRPLHREALRLVIEGPAQLAGIDVAAPLVDRLVEDTGSGQALPLLAFTLAELVDGVVRGGQLPLARYDQLGGVQGALARQADAALAEAVAASARSRDEVITGLLRLVTVDEQGRPTRWRVHRAELPDQLATELDAFVARRLLITDTDNDTVVISVAHEAFLSAWPPLAEAIAANVTALRARRVVEQAATEWHDHGRPPTRLWGGDQLTAAIADTGARLCLASRSAADPPPPKPGPSDRLLRHRVLVTDRVDLSSPAREFLHASVHHDRYRRRRINTVLAGLLIVALVATGVAVVARDQAQEGQRSATAGQLVNEAEAARGTDLRGALLLGLAAHRLHPDGATYSSLLNTLTAGPYLGTLTGHTGSVNSVTFASDGRTLATGSADHTVILWDLTNPAQPHRLGQPLTGHTGSVNSVTFSPDGRTLATGSADHTVILWDLTNPVQPHQLGQPLTGHTGSVNSVTFSPDGRTLATGSADHTVILWDLTGPARPRPVGSPLTGHTGPVTTMALTPDGRTLITGSADHTVIRWDLTDRTQPHPLGSPLTGHASEVKAIALTPDGHTLATINAEHTDAILWDVTNPAQPRQLGPPLSSLAVLVNGVPAFAPGGHLLATSGLFGTTMLWDVRDRAQPHPLGPPLAGHNSTVNVVTFAPDDRTLATGSDDGTVVLWDVANPVQPRLYGPLLKGHSSWTHSVVLTSDGRTLATSSGDSTVILWDVTDPAQPRQLGPPLTGHHGGVRSVAFAPDGRILASGSEDEIVILWDVTDPAQPRQLGPPLTGHSSPVLSVVFAPSERTLATGSADGTVILWDVTDPTQPRQLGSPLTGHTGQVWSVAFSPDGRTLATGSADGTVIVWDVTDPTQSRQLGLPLTGHTGRVNSVTFSSNGRTLATGSADQTVILWDVTNPARANRLGPALPSSTVDVSSVAFSPDGHTLATNSDYGNVILWDVTDPAQPNRLGPPFSSSTAIVMSVAFFPDGRTLATGSLEGTAALWDLTDLNKVRDSVVQRACSVTRGGLTRDEWARLVPGLTYQGTCPP